MRLLSTFGLLLRSRCLAAVVAAAAVTAPATSGLRAQTPAPAPPAAPAAAAPVVLSVDTAQSPVTFHMVHKLHRFDAVSKKVEGKVRILPTGVAQVMVRVPVESFDSANSNRDAHMKEVTEAARYPLVELKGLCDACATPASFPTTVDRTIKGELSFHGVKKSVEVPVKLTYESPSAVRAAANLTLSLDEFKIERPSLMFVKVDDDLKLDVNLVLKQ
jgi:polyisoprenoid-binding protein YceI